MNSNYLALDVGTKRVGLALASQAAKLPHPLMTVAYKDVFEELEQIIERENVGMLVVGLPMDRNNQATDQTNFTRKFIDDLKSRVMLPIETCDEALSSKRAKAELKKRRIDFSKEDVDSLAATYILEDYLKESGLV